MSWNQYRPYVSVGARLHQAKQEMKKLRKAGLDLQPIEIEGRKIARTFWGIAWCDHLESFSDYSNRLPRGQRYTRNGSVCHLEIEKGEINAHVAGSEIYRVKISIKPLPKKKWQLVKKRCSGKVSSLLDLLQGKISDSVMDVVTNQNDGLFPSPKEISLKCSCPDWAVMCKHVAAVLYGVGSRLDKTPEMLFHLRGVDHEELIDTNIGVSEATKKSKGKGRRIADDSLGDVFGIELSEEEDSIPKPPTTRRKKTAPPPKKKVAAARQITGKEIGTLRKKFQMSQAQFAKLLGVSTPTIGNWEKRKGIINLQPRSLKASLAVRKLTKKSAWKKLEDL